MKKSVYYERILAVCVVVYWPIFVIRDFLLRRWPKAVTRSEICNCVGICTEISVDVWKASKIPELVFFFHSPI